jgi:transcriptional regulator GlxA family with amidase domain
VVAFATQGVSSFELGMVSQVFTDRSCPELPAFAGAFCSDEARVLHTDLGLLMRVEHGLEAMGSADLILLLSTDIESLTVRRPVIDALIRAHRRGAIIAACGTGSFLLAQAGLLDGRRATTDRRLVARLAQAFPKVTVDAEALYVDEGRIVTCAGMAAGLDMCLHLVRREHGTAAFTAVAQDVMVAPRCQSGRVRHLPTAWDIDTTGSAELDDVRLSDLSQWVCSRLQQPLSVNDLARRAMMSPRTFARRFQSATGTTPHVWLQALRLDRAEELLETTSLPIGEISRLVGFGSGGVLRDHFVRRHGMNPRHYRNTFAHYRQASSSGRLPR